MAEVHTYDPVKIVFTFMGIRLTGFAEGTFLEAQRDEDGVSKYTGTDGNVCRAINRNRGGSITGTFTQSASVNDILSGYINQDEETGLIVGPALVRDLFGTTIIESPYTWIKKHPNSVYAKEVQARQYVFDCAELIMFNGGSIV